MTQIKLNSGAVPDFKYIAGRLCCDISLSNERVLASYVATLNIGRFDLRWRCFITSCHLRGCLLIQVPSWWRSSISQPYPPLCPVQIQLPVWHSQINRWWGKKQLPISCWPISCLVLLANINYNNIYIDKLTYILDLWRVPDQHPQVIKVT